MEVDADWKPTSSQGSRSLDPTVRAGQARNNYDIYNEYARLGAAMCREEQPSACTPSAVMFAKIMMHNTEGFISP